MPTLRELELDSGPGPLDMLWGLYFATGSYEPILRMVSVRPGPRMATMSSG
jgi:hypothetical protein